MKLIDKIYDFLFEETIVLDTCKNSAEEEKPVYISCSDLFIKQ